MAKGTLEDFIDQLNTAIGENHSNAAVTRFIDTGYAPLNEAISGRLDGGLPFGRMVEMFGESSSGKTALATQWMVAAQKMGGVAGFVDWERSFDVNLAEGFGLNTERPFWIYGKPKTWEDGNTFAAKACRAIRQGKMIPDDAPILFVFDSIASAVPQSMLYDAKGKDREIDSFTMNDTSALSRVTSTTLKVMAQYCEEYNATFLYLNQVRLKIGVVFGDPRCLRGDTVVPFADGTSATIETVVERKISKNVWSYNELTHQMEEKPIIGWHDNGSIDDVSRWVHIRAGAPNTKNGVTAVTVTPDHTILTNRGWVEACDINVGDKLISRTKKLFDHSAESFLRAVIAFDCSLIQPRSNGTTACLSLQDNNDPDYAKWKVEVLSKHLRFTETKIDSGVKHVSNFSSELKNLALCARNPLRAFGDAETITDVQLAIAIMDDGHYDDKGREGRYALSLRRYSGDNEYLDAFGDLLASRGLTFGIRYGSGRFDFDVKGSRILAGLIAGYVHPSMQRKLPADLRGKFAFKGISEPADKQITIEVPVVEVRTGSSKPGKKKMFDITVADNHNFLAGNSQNGFVVHNCTPGGKAMEFYSTARIALGRTKLMEQTAGVKEFVGQKITAQVTKSKLTKPFKECDIRMSYDEFGVARFDTTFSLIEHLLEKKLLDSPANGYVTWDGKRLSKRGLADKVDAEGLVPVLVGLLEKVAA